MQSILPKVVLILSSTIVGLGIGEITVRFLGLGQHFERSLLFSSPTWQQDAENAIRYLPNQKIRTVAVYNANIEYDVQFHTNNLGFIDHVDYARDAVSNRKHYAFVGDSFTAGYHGGEPWVPQLRDRVRNRNTGIYNLGIDGTGAEHFSRLLKSVNRQLSFTTIVIVAISNDFRRDYWYPQVQGNDIGFCREKAGPPKCDPIARIIPQDTAVAEVQKIAKQIADDREEDKGIFKQSQLLALFKQTKRNLFDRPVYSENHVERSLLLLRNIRDAFPLAEIHLVHLPQKEEVATGAYLLDFGERMEGTGIRYFPALKRCNWSGDMYFKHDAHPNSAGYKNISSCVSNYLFKS